MVSSCRGCRGCSGCRGCCGGGGAPWIQIDTGMTQASYNTLTPTLWTNKNLDTLTWTHIIRRTCLRHQSSNRTKSLYNRSHCKCLIVKWMALKCNGTEQDFVFPTINEWNNKPTSLFDPQITSSVYSQKTEFPNIPTPFGNHWNNNFWFVEVIWIFHQAH